MNICAPFIYRPIATTLITLALVLAGVLAFKLLPVAPLPQADLPVIIVRANLPGASPETMASSVATPLERALGQIAGINEITSSSSLGSSSVIMQFDLEREINGAARDVQAAINLALANLPSMPANPSYRKVNPAGAPIMVLSITSDVLTRPQLYDQASSLIAQKISQIHGVGDVTVGGGALPAIRINLQVDKLNSMGVNLDQVRTAIVNANSLAPKGMLDGNFLWLIEANDQLFSVQEYENIIIASNAEKIVRLKDVAKVSENAQDLRNMAMANGKSGIVLFIFKAQGANIIETTAQIRELIPQMQEWLPNATIAINMDRSITIKASLHEVEKSLIIAIILVILVTFAFLKNLWATLIPAIAAPASIIATFAVMYACDYSLDNLSLMALTISTGFVVDDAIVVVENIMRRLEMGENPITAALEGSREVAFTVFAISISLVAVFTPIMLMPGIVGRFFREFAVVLSVAVLISMLISLTTTPMLASQFLKKPEHNADQARFTSFWQKFSAIWSKGLTNLQNSYANSLQIVLKHRRITLFVFFLVLALNVWLYIIIPKGFFPQQDTGLIMGGFRADQSASYQSIAQKMPRLLEIIRNDPAVLQVSAHVSGSRGGGHISISLKPLDERKISAKEVVNRLRPALSKEPGLQIFLTPAQDIMAGGRSARSQFQYTLQADDLTLLRTWGHKLQDALKHNAIITDLDSDIEERGLQTVLDIDRERLAQLDLQMRDIDAALNNAFGQRQISTMYRDKNQYRVILELEEEYLEGPQALNKIQINSNKGKVPLLSLAKVESGFAPQSINHQSQFAAVTLSFNLKNQASLADAKAILEETRIKIGMPNSIIGNFQGFAKLYADTIKNQIIIILVALASLYIILGILYENLWHPITILSTLPPAGGGALIALLIFKLEFSVIALIGVLLLCGLVKKNAILMIDFALNAKREGKEAVEAIYTACCLRFRPIMMTTAAALFGAVPLVLGQGDGAELRQPLGVTIVGGLILSQLLTLYTTPVIFLALDSLSAKFARFKKRLFKTRVRIAEAR